LPAPSLRPLRILLAEDTDTTRYLVTSMLGRQGHTVIAVENGELAIQAVQGGAFDIAMIDMHMPVMDGLEAVRVIRAMSQPTSTMPIIALTADVIAESTVRYIDAGADIVVGKPIDWTVLTDEMIRLTGGRAPEESSSRSQAMKATSGSSDAFNEVMLDEIAGMLGVNGLKKLLAKFSANIESYRDKMLVAHDQGDSKALTDAAHALRGVAAQFGADHLTSLAQRVEENRGSPAEMDVVRPILINAVMAAIREAERRSAA
jgi:CheY-like chemotaxis protein